MGGSISTWTRRGSCLLILGIIASAQCRSQNHQDTVDLLERGELRIDLAEAAGLPAVILSELEGRKRSWLSGPVRLTVSDEADQKQETVARARVRTKADRAEASADLASLGISMTHLLEVAGRRAEWEMTFSGDGPRTGHEIEIELPVLFPEARIFTPSQYGVMDVSAYPSFEPAAYANYDWNHGQAYVLPLVSVMDRASDSALTLALPAEDNIPHLQVSWSGARVLRLRMAHRGIGGGRPTTLRLLFYVHPADYRSALQAYADDFPAYFRPTLPRGPFEGTFWYHHIHEHPSFEEMDRQHVRFTWTSFWFTHMGEFLPAAKEWHPYTYALEWKYGQKMSDEVINAFIRKMQDHTIGTYAYFNVTEFGGRGGEHGDAADADRVIEERLAPALVRDAEGRIIPTWQGSKVINPGRDYSYRPLLEEQVRRHIDRLTAFQGFMVDRLDWASGFDHGHDDGLSMIQDRPVENLAVPVADALQELCRMSHEAGKRVFVNQFWRVELLRDVDGYCHENDYLPAMAYLAPFRPASAWHQRTDYSGGLLTFEAQMKRRLLWALFPQMIAHEFPICQQAPNARAADFMELFAPLFKLLMGKEQVLIPHCVAVTGPNEANLFRNGKGHYVAPVASRVRFLCRPPRVPDHAELTLRVPDAAELKWAHIYSADGPPYRAAVEIMKGAIRVELVRHGSSSMVVAGKGPEPPLEEAGAARLDHLRERLFPDVSGRESASGRPDMEDIAESILKVVGAPVSASYPSTVVDILVDGQKAGEIRDGGDYFKLNSTTTELSERPPAISLVPGDEGTWLVPEMVELIARFKDGRSFRVASWEPGDACGGEGTRGVRLPLSWREPSPVIQAAAHFAAKDLSTGGSWKGKYGGLSCWMPSGEGGLQSGFGMQIVKGSGYTWAERVRGDGRILQHPADPGYSRRAACWYDIHGVEIRIEPPDNAPYRLTVYLLDYDRDGRAEKISISSGREILDGREVSPLEMEQGVYLSWQTAGPIAISARKASGANAVVCGIFVDRP